MMLSLVDPFAPEMSMKARSALIGAKAGFVMDLAWAARVLASREKAEREEAEAMDNEWWPAAAVAKAVAS